MSLSILENNLREIYLSEALNSEDPIKLVSNFSETRIYRSNSTWGRIWNWIFNVLSHIYDPDLKTAKLHNAAKKTDEIFRKSFLDLEDSISAYKDYCEFRTLDIPLDENIYHLARKKINDWNRATAPFINKYLVRTQEIEELNVFLNSTSAFTEEQQNDLRNLLRYQHLIDLEGYLHEPLPLPLFKKLACKTKLNNKELTAIKKWIKRHNEKDSALTVRPFHLALKSFIDILENENGESGDLVALELELANLGLKVFEQKDPVHMAWRDSLKQGSQLHALDGIVTLDQQLSHKDPEQDKNLIFTIEEDPNKVIFIGINQTIPAFKKFIKEKYGAGIPSVTCIETADSGNYAVYEKLHGSLDCVEWTSQHGKISENDLDILTPVANLLKWMIENDMSPRSLDPHYLMFNKQGILKYAKVCILEKFSHSTLEDFIFRCSNGNRTVFCYLMHKSGLSDHPHARFYLKIIRLALNNQPCIASNLAAVNSIVDGKIVDRSEQLYHTIIGMKILCKNTILTNYEVSNLEKLENRINEQLMQFYIETHLNGILWPEMENEVILRCIRLENLKPRNR